MKAEIRKETFVELLVVFETSVLYTESPNHLLKQQVAEIIRESKYDNLRLKWFLPEMVIDERIYQMQRNAQNLLPNIQQLEKILETNLGITKDIVNRGVKAIVERQLREFGITVLKLETNQVDWERVMKDAAHRNPPFDPGKTEKGFRDALICESIMQLASQHRVEIACVTGDRLLTEAIVGRKGTLRVLASLEELKSLFNTLAAELNEEFVSRMQMEATKLFFTPGDKTTLFLREDIRGRIEKAFDKELKTVPEGADFIENGVSEILSPVFLRKADKTVYWGSGIHIRTKAYEWGRWSVVVSGLSDSIRNPNTLSGSPISWEKFVESSKNEQTYSTWAKAIETWVTPSPQVQSAIDIFLPSTEPRRAAESPRLVVEGKRVFEVIWSGEVLNEKEIRFNHISVEDIKFIETLWE